MSVAERRQANRFVGRLPVEWNGGTGLTRDFSALGIYFETEQPLSLGERIEFVIGLAHAGSGHLNSVRFQGEVVRVEPNGSKTGIAVAVHTHAFEGLSGSRFK